MKKKDIIILSAKIIATLFLFYYVNKTVNFSEIPKVNNSVLVFFIALSFGFLQQFLLFCRWFFSVRVLGISCGIKSVVKSYFIGQFLGTVSPARSGDLAKVFYLENTGKKRGAYAVILDAAVAVITLFITGLWKDYPQNCEKSVLIIDKILSVAGIAAFIAIVIFTLLSYKFKPNRFFSANFARLFSVSLLQHAVLIIQGALVFSILLPVSFAQASFAVAGARCVMPLIPFAIASIGVREFSFSLFISAFIPEQNVKPVVFAASYILLLCNSVIFMIPRIFLFYFRGKKRI